MVLILSSAQPHSAMPFDRFATEFGIFAAFSYAAVPDGSNTGNTTLELIPVAERTVCENRESSSSLIGYS